MNDDIVLLGGGHAHLAALRHWRCNRKPVVVTRAAVEAYSGQVPAVLRGERRTAEMRLGRAVAAVGGSLVIGECVAIDPAARALRLADGRSVWFGLLSLDLGAASAAPPGAVPVRPATGLLAAVARIEADCGQVASEARGPVVVVGGGAVGTELALALACRWAGRPAVALLCPGAPLPGAPAPIRRRAACALADRGVAVVDARAAAVGAAGVTMQDGRDLAASAVFWAAGLVASGLPRAAGLACDAAGFVAVDGCLRSLSHPFVLAAGDGAALGVAKSGAFAVSAGTALARSLAWIAAGRAPPPWQPPRRALAIVGLGDGSGLAWRGNFWLAGRPAWWLKSALDQHWLRKLQ